MNEDLPKRGERGRYSSGTRLPRGTTHRIEREPININDYNRFEHGVGRVLALVIVILMLFNIYSYIWRN